MFFFDKLFAVNKISITFANVNKTYNDSHHVD